MIKRHKTTVKGERKDLKEIAKLEEDRVKQEAE